MLHRLFVLAILAPGLSHALGLGLTHDGYLLGANDAPLTNPAQALTFKLFEAATPGAGETPLWQATCTVAVRAGYYAVTLGDGCGTAFTTEFPADASRYLELTIEGAAMTPRLHVGPTPAARLAERALDADKLGGLAPTAFAAATHTHAAGDVTGLATVATSGSWNDLQNKPISFPPSAHTHAAGTGVTGLATVATSGLWTDVQGRPGTFPPSTHTHAATEITGLADALAGATVPGAFAVTGGLKLGTDTTCTDAKAGTLRWTGSAVEVCVSTSTGWKSVSSLGSGTANNPATSCNALFASTPGIQSGTYWLDTNGGSAGDSFPVWCDMSAADGGWTLVFKSSSTSTLFGYQSSHWTTDTTVSGAADPTVNEDMKNQAFNSLPFSQIRFCLSTSTNCLQDTKSAASAKALFTTASATTTPFTRASFMAWDPTADSVFSGEPNCNDIGYVRGGGYAKCRFGISVNNEPDCASNNSAIGFGCQEAYNSLPVSAGAAFISAAYPYRGWIWVR